MKDINKFRQGRVIRQSGFSLLEILITVVISAIGLLGLASLQAAGLRNNHNAYQVSQASVLAYDIADRMRANVASAGKYLSSYTPPEPETITKVEIVNGVPVVIIETTVVEELQTEGCGTTGGCTSDQMARADVVAWATTLANTLPSGTGTITLAGGLYTVGIRWDDNRSGAIDDADPTFQMSFRM